MLLARLAVLAFTNAADAQTAPAAPDSVEGHLAAGKNAAGGRLSRPRRDKPACRTLGNSVVEGAVVETSWLRIHSDTKDLDIQAYLYQEIKDLDKDLIGIRVVGQQQEI
jgi:hypothetical protein